MRKIIFVLTGLLLFLTVLFFCAGCRYSRTPIRLLTDTPHIAGYIEIYNDIQDNYIIELIYSDTPVEDILYKNISADLVIGEHLAAPQISGSFSSLEAIRKNLDFRFLTLHNKIPVNEEILYSGIFKNSSHKKACEEFLLWFINRETQNTLLSANSGKNPPYIFGIAGGFSVFKEINQKIAEQKELHIPVSEKLLFPSVKPDAWPNMKHMSLYPIFNDAIERGKEINKIMSNLH